MGNNGKQLHNNKAMAINKKKLKVITIKKHFYKHGNRTKKIGTQEPLMQVIS
jgi:hypothetical protein